MIPALRLVRGNIWYVFPILSWYLVYSIMPTFFMLLTSDTFLYFLNDVAVLLPYVFSFFVFVVLLILHSRIKYRDHDAYISNSLGADKNTYLITLFLFLVLIIWSFESASFDLKGQSKSDYLMSRQDEIVKSGSGSGMFRRQLEYLFYLFIGWGLYIGQRKEKYIKLFVVYILLQLVIVFFGGLYRSPLIAYTLFGFFVFYKLYLGRNTFYNYLIILSISLPFLMSLLAFLRDGRSPEWIGLIGTLAHGLSGFATVLEIRHLYDNPVYENGYQFMLNFITFIPRFLWPDKPVTSFSFRVSEEIFGQIGVDAAWIHTFTILGEGYRQFAGLGMIFSSFIAAFLVLLIISIILKNPSYRILGAFIMIMFPIIFRGDLNSLFGRTYEFLIAIFIFETIRRLSPRVKNDI